MSNRRKKYINVPAEPAYKALVRLGIGDPVVLVCDDIEVTVTVEKLEKARLPK